MRERLKKGLGRDAKLARVVFSPPGMLSTPGLTMTSGFIQSTQEALRERILLTKRCTLHAACNLW